MPIKFKVPYRHIYHAIILVSSLRKQPWVVFFFLVLINKQQAFRSKKKNQQEAGALS